MATWSAATASSATSASNQHWFTDLDDARETIAAWREDYNAVRPHNALGNFTPLDFAERLRQPEVLSA